MAGEIYLSNLSGQFDYQTILDKYQQLKSQQIAILQEKEAAIYNKKFAYQSFGDLLSSFASSFEKATDLATFDKKNVVVSNENILKATITDSSKMSETNLNIVSKQLAKNDVWLSQSGISNKDTNAVATNNGTIEISYAGAVVATIDYDADTTNATRPSTLQEIADAINSAQDSVNASIFYDGTDFRLILSGANTGASNTISISETGSGDLLDQLELGDSYSSSNVQVAQNSELEIYGQIVESSTNIFDSLIDGLRVELLSTSTSGVDISIANNYEDVSNSLQEFVDGYNSIVDFIKENTKEGAPLSGDFTIQRVRSSLFQGFDPLFELDILSVDYNTGKLSLNSSKLDNKLQTDPDLVKIKIEDLNNNLQDYINYITGYDSPIKLKDKTFDKQIDYYEDSIISLAKTLDTQMENLKREFIWLDQFLSQMNDIQMRISSLFLQSPSNENNQ